MSDPKTGIIYRIQNVDFGTYLELWDIDEELLVLRPFKDTELQQWIFIKDTSNPGDRYKILAVSSQNLASPVHLGLSAAGDSNFPRPPVPPKAIMGDSGFSLWGVSKQTDGSFAITTKGRDPRHEAFLRVTESGMLDTVEKRLASDRLVNRSMRWKLVEFWPAVSKGVYRIRTLNGAALDISPSMEEFSAVAVRKDYRQEWEVEPKGNGKCLISMRANENDKIYLGWQRGNDDIAKIAPSKDPTEWIVKLLGEYTYSITFYYAVGDSDETTLKLALSITDDEVLLKPRKVAHNQIWFFESIDALKASKPRQFSQVGQPYGEINQGVWKILNVQTGQYATFYNGTSRWAYLEHPSGNHTRIEYINNGNTFYMSADHYTVKHASFAGDTVDIVDGTATATAWVLERHNDPAGGYVYYICPSFDRTQCISGETVSELDGYKLLKVTTKKTGTRIHQWKFVRR